MEIGWSPLSRSITARRCTPSSTPSASNRPRESGPRCSIASHIRSTTPGSPGPSLVSLPAIPHMASIVWGDIDWRDEDPDHRGGRVHRIEPGAAPARGGARRAGLRQPLHGPAVESSAGRRGPDPRRRPLPRAGERRGRRRGGRLPPRRHALDRPLPARSAHDERDQRRGDPERSRRRSRPRRPPGRGRVFELGLRRRRRNAQARVRAPRAARALPRLEARRRALLLRCDPLPRARDGGPALLQRLRGEAGPGLGVRRGGAEVHRRDDARRAAAGVRRRHRLAGLHLHRERPGRDGGRRYGRAGRRARHQRGHRRQPLGRGAGARPERPARHRSRAPAAAAAGGGRVR